MSTPYNLVQDHCLSPWLTQQLHNWPLCFNPSPFQFIFSRAAKVIMLKHVCRVIPHLKILQWFSISLKKKKLNFLPLSSKALHSLASSYHLASSPTALLAPLIHTWHLLFLRYVKHAPTSGPWHLLFPLLQQSFPRELHSSFLQFL